MRRFLYWISDFSDRLIGRIEKNSYVEEKQLGLFRIFVGVFLLFVYTPSWNYLGEIPQAFFNPPVLSIAYLFDDFLPSYWFIFMDVSFYVMMLFITIGYYSRFSLILAFVTAIFANSFAFSLGKINHDIMIWLLLPVLAFTNSGTTYAVKEDRPVSRELHIMSLAILSICLVFGMFSAGYFKLRVWVDFNLNENGFLRWFYNNFFNNERTDFLAPYLFDVPVVIFEIMDYLAVIFELSAGLFLVAGRRLWRFYLGIAVVFHISNLLFLNIDFAAHIAVYSLFLLSPFLLWVSEKFSFTGVGKKVFTGILIAQVFLLCIGAIIGESYSINVFSRLYVSLFLWLVLLFITIYSFKKKLYVLDDVESKHISLHSKSDRKNLEEE